MLSHVACQGSYSNDPLPLRYDPAFKLFGTTIPASSPSSADEHSSTSLQMKMIEATEARNSAAIKKGGHAQGAAELDDYSSVPDDFESSLVGRNDGCTEEIKPSEEVSEDLGPIADVRSSLLGVSGVSAPALADLERTKATDSEFKADLVDIESKKDEDNGSMLDDGVRHGALPMENETSNKPEKPIPCPRCNSLDTKFCYFNNYNVSQPRHFCKNCQRYWTAGGTLRNVPVGAGRRRNKHNLSSSTHQRSLLADGLVVSVDSCECAQQLLSPPKSLAELNKNMKAGPPLSSSLGGQHSSPPLSSLGCSDSPPSSTVISFGKESLLVGGQLFKSQQRGEILQGYKSDIMVGQENLHLPSKTEADLPEAEDLDMRPLNVKNESDGRKCAGLNLGNSAALANWENMPLPTVNSHQLGSVETQPVPPCSSAPCMTLPAYRDAAALAWVAGAPFSFMGGPWPCSGNAGWGDAAPSTLPWQSPPEGAVGTNSPGGPLGVEPLWAGALGGLWTAGIPWPLMQNPFWVPPVCWGGMPWAPAAAASAVTGSPCTLNDPTLGKHPREEAPDGGEGVLAPKTLRVGNPEDAARSSIWAALGIDKVAAGSLASGGFFSAFRTKVGSKGAADAFHAQTRSSNPAALSRSMAFQESNLALDAHGINEY